MRVETDAGEVIELGDTDASPTIGIIDYSRRVTDDFGVTTVVERGFARRVSVRLGVPFDDGDILQRRLAALRATPALWVADDRYASLKVRGLYKDFTLDLAAPPLSYCTLTVEGFPETAPFVDPGGDPAPEGQISTLRLLQPVAIPDAALVSTNVAEDDAPEWAPATSYAIGARVIRSPTHRIYESVVADNVGTDPAGLTSKWLDVGPKNRWAMFDQALGSSTNHLGSITVTLNPGAVNAVALLDVVGTTVRVQADGYDYTATVSGGAVTFLDLPAGSGQITVAIAGPGTVSVGTILVGNLRALGLTEAAPTAGITDYSRKVIDDFGQVTIVQRGWSKRMTARALIRTDALDTVVGRIAAVRALPSLWIGQTGIDSLTVYGFFKDFSIEVGPDVSKLSLAIEGFSAAAKVQPLRVDWPNVGDPDGTKPDDNATNSGDPSSPLGPDGTVGGNLAEQKAKALALLRSLADREIARIRDRAMNFPGADGASVATLLAREVTGRITADSAFAEIFELLGAVTPDGQAFVIGDKAVFATPNGAGGTDYEGVAVAFAEQRGSIEEVREVLATDVATFARAILQLDVNGRVVGMTTTNTGDTSSMVFVIDQFTLETPDGVKLLYADATDGGRVKMPNVVVDTLKIDTVTGREMAQGAVMKTAWGSLSTNVAVAQGATVEVFHATFVKEDNDSVLKVQTFLNLQSGDDLQCDVSIQCDGMVMSQAQRINLILDNTNSQAQAPLTPFVHISGILAGTRTITVKVYNREVDNIPVSVVAGSAIEITEMRKAGIGSITGSGGPLPPQGSGGSGTAGGGGYNGAAHN
ncbi:hypothetical protein [Sphingomonas sp. PB4P5]|uniref:hypothetical protein n=1 Tax=Parasphingomonas puruogangriensis TaxID=3096155 RepID=UPI002FC8CC13